MGVRAVPAGALLSVIERDLQTRPVWRQVRQAIELELEGGVMLGKEFLRQLTEVLIEDPDLLERDVEILRPVSGVLKPVAGEMTLQPRKDGRRDARLSIVVE